MSIEILKAICDARDVRRIGIVDDVFDTPAPEHLNKIAYRNFGTYYRSSADFQAGIAWAVGSLPEVPEQLDDLEDNDLRLLWRALWQSYLGGRKMSADKIERLRTLFSGHSHDVLGMLDIVVGVLHLFRKGLERSVAVFGTDYDADEVLKNDIVLVDFFLGQGLSVDQALELSSDVVRQVADAAIKAKKTVPSFLLVSSQEQDVKVEKFRGKANLMKSRFRFFPKKSLTDTNVAEMINLHDLVDASPRAELVEGLLNDWRSGAIAAVNDVHDRMMKLDIADLVYLDCFRLAHEGIPVGNYLRWFLTASLHAGVTRQLKKPIWKKAETRRLFDEIDQHGQIDVASIMKTFDGPSDIIAGAYGDILFDESRSGAIETAFPGLLMSSDLIEGDLFVKPRGRDRKGLQNAEVRLVLTPSCDLISRRPGEPPAAGRVIVLPGKLMKLTDDIDKYVTQDFIRAQERGESAVFRLEWEFKNPISIEWGVLSTEGFGKGFRRLGRIRELYFHKIRDNFANQLSRIGMEVPPLFPRARSGRVSVAVTQGGKRKHVELFTFSEADRQVWEIGPISQRKSNGQHEERFFYQATRNFVSRLHEALVTPADAPEPLKDALQQGRELLQKMENYMQLVKPLQSGTRGVGNDLEIKKSIKRSTSIAASQAHLLIETFKSD